MRVVIDRAQWRRRGSPVRRLGVRAGVAAVTGGHQRDQYGGPQRVLERAVARARQLAGHAQQRQRRRHWVRWVRFVL